jgi:hypothetical protein
MGGKRQAKPGDKSTRPTINDIAHRARVAPKSVSRIINNSGYVSEVMYE